MGALLIAAPSLFGFADDAWFPHLVFGLAEVGAARMTNTAPTRTPRIAEPACAIKLRNV